MNKIKEMADKVGHLVAELDRFNDPDPRWLSIGRTHLQQGFMAITRAIAKPETF